MRNTESTEALEPDEWIVGLPSRVIQDGNYGDFAVRQRARFAIEFFSDRLVPIQPGDKAATHIGDGRYTVTAEVAAAHDGLLVLDFGLLAYLDVQPPNATTFEWRSGIVDLGTDPFMYFEQHAQRANLGIMAAVGDRMG